jgi:hypothetical protein
MENTFPNMCTIHKTIDVIILGGKASTEITYETEPN